MPTVVKSSRKAATKRPAAGSRKKASVLPLPTRLTQTGRVLVCGAGDTGQLGLGPDEFEKSRPAVLPGFENIVDVYAGGMHTLVLNSDGQIYSFGCNDEGALGRDTSEEGSECSPGLVELPGKAVMICAGDSHSACLLDDGSVYAWGSFRDSHGNMGMTVDGNKRSPTNILPGQKCVKIASGTDHLAMLTENGKLFTIGCAEQGQLGRVSKRAASGDGRRGKVAMLQPQEVVVLRSKRFIDLWASKYCTFVKEQDTNKIWAWGLNNYKQLAYDASVEVLTVARVTEFPDVQIICGGQHHTVALDQGGSVWVIGRHEYGRLGLGAIKQDVTALTKLDAFGGEPVRFVCCGEATSFAITKSEKLYGWGTNTTSQLGTGVEEDAVVPVQIVSKNLPEKSIIKVSSGGQHSVFLVKVAGNAAKETQDVNGNTKLNSKGEATNKGPNNDSSEPTNKRKK